MKKKREAFNDLLLPVILALTVMPFIIRLTEQDTGLGKYLWFSDNEYIQDLYAYYRSRFFITAAGCAAIVLAFRMALYREKTKKLTYYYALAGYLLLALLSSVTSVNTQAAFWGNLYHYEGFFVIAGYVVIGFYSYQIMETERDYRTIRTGILIMFELLFIVGVFQIAGKDLLNYEWVQKLVMPAEYYELYRGEIGDLFSGNNVFLTLFNPNYAGVFLTMFTALFFVLFMEEKDRKWKLLYMITVLQALILVWFTYSRSTVVALAAGLFVYIIMSGRRKAKMLYARILPGILGLLVLLTAADAYQGFPYLSRILDEKEVSEVERILTRDDGVLLDMEKKTLVLSVTDDNKLQVKDENGKLIKLRPNQDGEYRLPFHTDVRAFPADMENMKGISMYLNGYSLLFVRQDETYYYYNENGKLDKMTDIETVNMHGMEHLGSGRMYIWSRTLPLLKEHLLLGSGPDTYPEVFPQNDYVGKMIYSHKTSRIMEGAHNMYLTWWIQTGLLSLICFLIFCIFFIKKCIRAYGQTDNPVFSQNMGLGCFLGCICFLTCGLFNDSTLFTSPVFFIFSGLALAAL